MPTPPPNTHIQLDDDILQEWINGYKRDPHLSKIWDDPKMRVDNWVPGHRFFKDDRGLVFFRDADYQPRLCVLVDQ